MDKVFDWSAPLVAASSGILQGFLEYLPQLSGAVIVFIAGWFIAKAVRALITRAGHSLGNMSKRAGLGRAALNRQVTESLLVITSNVAFWLIVLFFLTFATSLMGLTLFTGWLDQVIVYLPSLLSGALIIVAGIIIGNLTRDVITTTAVNLPEDQKALLARGGQIMAMGTMIVIGIDQIGIDVTVLITVIAIVVGAMLGGVAIAFGLGSKNLVSNLVGARYLNRDYRVGDTIRIGDVQGTILELSAVAMILDTQEGRLTVPAKVFSEQSSLLVDPEAGHVG